MAVSRSIWSASATATNYFVKRSTVSGSGYTGDRDQLEPDVYQHRIGQRHVVLLCGKRVEQRRREHEFCADQCASDIARARHHQCNQSVRAAWLCLAGGPHGLAVAIADKQSRHKLGQRHKFGTDESGGDAGGQGERRGVLPVGAAVITGRMLRPQPGQSRRSDLCRRNPIEGGSEDGSVSRCANTTKPGTDPFLLHSVCFCT